MPAWMTPGGFIDPGKFPIDDVLRQALGEDAELFHGAAAPAASNAAAPAGNLNPFQQDAIIVCCWDDLILSPNARRAAPERARPA